ncbi:MAG: DUF1161 domain-containing protein [Gallionella sp.]
MRKFVMLACLSLVSFSAMASCDDLKAKIDGNLQAKGVKSYTLEIVTIGKASDATEAAPASGVAATAESKGKVVGTCEGDTKQIIYKRN